MKPALTRPAILALIQIAGLSVLLLITLLVELQHGREAGRYLAETTARVITAEKLRTRELFLATGGAYLKTGERVAVGPGLAHRRDRDIHGAGGELFTLVTPAQLLALGQESDANGLRLHAAIKSHFPMDSGEMPDAWEKEALDRFQEGQREQGLVTAKDGRRFLRYMVPVTATAACVRNRPGQKLTAGGLLGGLSLTLPMAPFEAMGNMHMRKAVLIHALLWLLGAAVIGWSFLLSRRHEVSLRDAEKTARDAREDLEKTFDAIDDIMTVQTMDMRIVRLNKAACEFFRAAEDELIGSYCYELFRGAAAPCPDCPEIESLKDGRIHRSQIEHPGLGKTFAVSAAPIFDEQGRVVKLVHRARDITASLALERQLRHAQKMEAIGNLAGGIAHDFNNILAGIIGYAELAQRALPEGSAPRRDVQEVIKAGLRARDLVRQILTISRRTEQKYQPLRVQLLVKEALKLLRASIPVTIDIKQKVAEDPGLVIADPTEIHQVVMNLCTNAYHSMRDKGGVLSVSLTSMELSAMDAQNKIVMAPGSYLRLTVSDSGCGMDARTRERIFDPYFTTKEQGEGSGLGLALVHGIVTGIGGHISVYSEPGMGTLIHVYLPVAQTRMDPGADNAYADRIPGGTERVLVVDDEDSVLTMEKRILESLGYQVTAFTDSEKARDVFAADPDAFDLLVTDMTMPRVSGADMMRECRARRADLPVIICTGFSDRISEEKVGRSGKGRLLMKPVTVRDLALAVREVLG